LAFASNGQGDVLVSFEAEVLSIVVGIQGARLRGRRTAGQRAVRVPGGGRRQGCGRQRYPQRGDTYLQFLYSREMQQLLTTFYYRVHDPEVVKATASRFPTCA
jgi:sulfate transport system substrate-binding protein